MPSFIPSNATGLDRTRMTYTSTPSTIQSQGLYYQPPVPANSQSPNLQGADNRGYVRQVQGNETVSGQLTGLLDQENPYIQNARQRGIEQANSRGNINSSIAAGNSQRAAIESALPIAQQDAATYSQTAGQNQDAMNQNLMQERDIANRVMLDREGRLDELEKARLAADVQRYGIDVGMAGDREQRAFLGEQQGLDRAHQFGMTGYQAQIADWMANQNLGRSEYAAQQGFNRDMYAGLAQMQVASLTNFMSNLNQAFLNDPETFGNQEALSGWTTFFDQNIIGDVMENLWAQFFPQGG